MDKDKVIENGLAAIDEVSDLVWKLIQTRKAKGITQKQVAEYMGTRVSDVARFEDMLVIPKVKTVILYAAAIGEKIGIDKTTSIEKPIGCPLEIFLQIFSKGIHVKNSYTNYKIEHWHPQEIKVIDAGSQWDICKIGKYDKFVGCFNFGKTWSIKREDLE